MKIVVDLDGFKYERRADRMKALKNFQAATGFSIIPVSYFEPVPDIRNIDLESKKNERVLDLDFRFKEEFLKNCYALVDNVGLRNNLPTSFFAGNDAVCYVGMINLFRPKTIVEIGAGHSTRLAVDSVAALNLETQVLAVEPAPNSILQALAAKGSCRLFPVPLQNAPDMVFDTVRSLKEGDILFYDGSHVTTRGGDTNFFFTKILPMVKPGVAIHVHDIYLPWDYPIDLYYGKGRFYSEQYSLMAILANSKNFEPLISVYDCVQRCPELGNSGASFWMVKR